MKNNLAYSGVLPFILCLFAYAFGYGDKASFVFMTYSTVILAFMAGTLWGNALINKQVSNNQNSYIVSNILTLLGFFSLLVFCLSNTHLLKAITIIINAVGFFALLAFEKNQHHLDNEYALLRSRVSYSVIVLHAIMAALLLFY